MERWSSSLIYPLTACALGAAAAFAFAAVAAPVWASFAIGLSTAVGALALRNWWIGEEERPLLAEELMGLHDAVDALRAESQELRDMMSEAVELAEYRISEDAGAPGAPRDAAQDAAMKAEAARAARAEAMLIDAQRLNSAQNVQLKALENRISALEDAAREPIRGAATPFVDRFEERLGAHEARTRKLAHALSIAIDATRRHSQDIRRLSGPRPSAEHDVETPSAQDAVATTPTPTLAPAPPPQKPLQEPLTGPFAAPLVRPERPKSPAAPRLRSVERPTPTTTPTAADRAATGETPLTDPDAALRVQPVFRADAKALALLEVLPDGETQADLDAGALLDRALGLAASFKRKDGELAALFAISLAALRSEATLAPLLAQLRADPGVAPLLAPSIAHAEIAELTDQDVALMRRLADAGIRFALRDVDGAALDPERAAAAGVAFIVLDVAGVAAREAREKGALARLSRRLAQRGLTLVLTGVDTAPLEDLASGEPGVLAQGAAFAPPRRIRFS